MRDLVTFGDWLRRRRKTLDLTQKELAERVGCSVVTITKIEQDQRRPSRQVAALLAVALELPADEHEDFIRAARAERMVEDLPGPQAAGRPGLPISPLPPLARQAPAASSGLPALPTPFIGRTFELAEILRLLHDPSCRLLTLTGVGGIGKTYLATEAARSAQESFPDGAFFVPLAPVASPGMLVAAIAESLGFSFYGARDLSEQLLLYMRDKACLLVLDNLEHLLDEAMLLVNLLQSAPRVKLLVTSRERLNVHGEWVLEIYGLPVPPSSETEDAEKYSAIALFLERARRAQLHFSPQGENMQAIVHICQMLAGMPLGIELAAAWVRVLSPVEIAEEIERSLDFLATGARDLPERHRSLRAVFSHSWGSLSASEQDVLMGLSVFRGGFQRAAAEQVAGASLSTISALLDKSLLRRSDAGRYDMHELVRQYAHLHLAEDPGRLETALNRHCEYYAARMQSSEPLLVSEKQPEMIIEYAAEIHNIRQAWSHAVSRCKHAQVRMLAWSLQFFHVHTSQLQEGQALFRQAVAGLQAGGYQPGHREADLALGTALAFDGYFSRRLGQFDQARQSLHTSLNLIRPHGEPYLLAVALSWLGTGEVVVGSYAEAEQALKEALRLLQEEVNGWMLLGTQDALGRLEHARGNYREAQERFEASLAISHSYGGPRTICFGLCIASRTALALGDQARAEELLQEAMTLSSAETDQSLRATISQHLGLLALARGEHNRAAGLHQEATAVFQEIGELWSVTQARTDLARAQLAAGEVEAAQLSFRQALRDSLETGIRRTALEALGGLAEVLATKTAAGTPAADRVLEILDFVMQDPASSYETRERAAHLWADLSLQAAPASVVAARSRAGGLSLDQIAQEISIE